MAIVSNMASQHLELFNNEINRLNLLRNLNHFEYDEMKIEDEENEENEDENEDEEYNEPPPPAIALAPTLNVREQENALFLLHQTPGEDVIIEASSGFAYWRTSRFFYIRNGESIYYLSTNNNITNVYSVERVQ